MTSLLPCLMMMMRCQKVFQPNKSSFRFHLFASLFDDDDEMSKSISTKQIKNHLYLFASLFDDGVPAAGEAELVEGVGRALRELF